MLLTKGIFTDTQGQSVTKWQRCVAPGTGPIRTAECTGCGVPVLLDLRGTGHANDYAPARAWRWATGRYLMDLSWPAAPVNQYQINAIINTFEVENFVDTPAS